MNYKKILVAIEFLAKEQTILHTALDVAEKYNAELTVLHINTDMAGVPSRAMRSMEHKVTKEELEELVKKNNPNNVTCKLDIVKSNKVMETVIDKTKDHDLLVLGHTHVNFFEEFLTDSVDEKIINRVHCHCLVVNKD